MRTLERKSVAAICSTIYRFNSLAMTLCVGLGLGKPKDFAVFLPLPAFLKQLDALETLQNIALCGNGACTL
jgi:hypothetical protein